MAYADYIKLTTAISVQLQEVVLLVYGVPLIHVTNKRVEQLGLHIQYHLLKSSRNWYQEQGARS